MQKKGSQWLPFDKTVCPEEFYNSRTQMFRKLIGSLGSP